jgi:hypothetical protein
MLAGGRLLQDDVAVYRPDIRPPEDEPVARGQGGSRPGLGAVPDSADGKIDELMNKNDEDETWEQADVGDPDGGEDKGKGPALDDVKDGGDGQGRPALDDVKEGDVDGAEEHRPALDDVKEGDAGGAEEHKPALDDVKGGDADGAEEHRPAVDDVKEEEAGSVEDRGPGPAWLASVMAHGARLKSMLLRACGASQAFGHIAQHRPAPPRPAPPAAGAGSACEVTPPFHVPCAGGDVPVVVYSSPAAAAVCVRGMRITYTYTS